ncbi:MAG: HPr kinase/phosphatase C-terminal domain-containing protein [Pseudomonadota bacterium]
MAPPPTVHAGAVALGEAGVLIRGAPGSGKSTLALTLVSHWQGCQRFAALVADDRTALTAAHGRIIARPAQNLAGLAELHGIGVRPVSTIAAVRLSLVVDLLAEPPRMPDPQKTVTEFFGLNLPRVTLRERAAETGKILLWELLNADGLTSPLRATQRGPD